MEAFSKTLGIFHDLVIHRQVPNYLINPLVSLLKICVRMRCMLRFLLLNVAIWLVKVLHCVYIYLDNMPEKQCHVTYTIFSASLEYKIQYVKFSASQGHMLLMEAI